MRTDHVFEEFKSLSISNEFNDYHEPKNFDCLRLLVDTYERACGKFDDYSLKYVKYLVNECETLPFEQAVDVSVHKIN